MSAFSETEAKKKLIASVMKHLDVPNDNKKKTSAKKPTKTGDASTAAFKDFLTLFYNSAPLVDIKKWDNNELVSVARSIYELSVKRKVKENKIRVFNPHDKNASWAEHKTVIEVVSANVPFIVDSIAEELHRHKYLIHFITHPMMVVERSKEGSIESVSAFTPKSKRDLSESFIHIQLTKQLTPKAIEELQASLEGILEDVMCATADWRPMLSKMQEITSELQDVSKTICKKHNLAKDRVDETLSFLNYLVDNHFTFLGYREYNFKKDRKTALVKDSGIGILRNDNFYIFEGYRDLKELPPEVLRFREDASPIAIRKSTRRSRVHRNVPLDVIIIKKYDKEGNVIGEGVFIGLFTSTVYAQSVLNVPYIRRRVELVLDKSSYAEQTHDYKALLDVLEKYPRDELFQSSLDHLLNTAVSIVELKERQRVAVFNRVDDFQRFITFTVYVPRDRFNTRVRERIETLLEKSTGGHCEDYFTTLDDSVLARVIYIIHFETGKIKKFENHVLEEEIAELTRSWSDKMRLSLVQEYGVVKGAEIDIKYDNAFSAAYQIETPSDEALRDIRKIEQLQEGGEIAVDFDAATGKQFSVRLYHRATPIVLSDILPIFENLGFRVMTEEPYEVEFAGEGNNIWIHNFTVECKKDCITRVEDVKQKFEDCVLNIWNGTINSDKLNSLVIEAGLTWQQVLILRTYARYLRQALSSYSRGFIKDTICAYPQIARQFVELFEVMHDPKENKNREKQSKDIIEKIYNNFGFVATLNEDNVLRSILSVLRSSLRTNFYQRDEKGNRKPYISIKINSAGVTGLPLPVPYREIFVYSPDVEGIHLRSGEIARGGLRWSDRDEDYRTEVLGLMKAQYVKNSVIVPVGAKGGFVVQKPPKEGGREAYLEEGIRCYKIFISALLDITDNIVKNKVVRPKDVFCHDSEDPYFVVAADKGTATFSNIANAKSLEYGFWLGDAFASGGSEGYDHKKMGITAKGAWESVKRHFREIGKDIQKEEFTVTGVGDMSGDVFGNGMLLSEQTKLIAAFNHIHIFCDPNPDTKKSFVERKRLFDTPRSTWMDYSDKVLSKGGRIYSRADKFLKLTPEIKESLGISKNEVTPDELMKAILTAKVELLWLGGIGTYVKSKTESHTDVGDRANDAVRIGGEDIMAQVVGEGANLGFTQKGRIEYARKGGRLNADFIDNAAGVDTSDHEVNIKILLADVMSKGKMDRKERNKLLAKMEPEVSALVLKNNYQQTQALTLSAHKAPEYLQTHASLIKEMEKQGTINRIVENLPLDEELDERASLKQGLTRPELAILTSYSKISFFNALMQTKLIESPELHNIWLINYFPKDLGAKFSDEIKKHKLYKQIIATELAGSLINRMGFAFPKLKKDKTGATSEQIAKAYVIVKESADLVYYWKSVEALDNKVSADVQSDMMIDITRWADRLITWYLTQGDASQDIHSAISIYQKGITRLKEVAESVMPANMIAEMKQRKAVLTKQGVPEKFAREIALLPALSSACELISVSKKLNKPVEDIARIYYELGSRLHLDWLRTEAKKLKAEGYWQSVSLTGMVDDLYTCQARLTQAILSDKKISTAKGDTKKVVEAWLAKQGGLIEQLDEHVDMLQRKGDVTLPMLFIADQKLRAFNIN